MKKIMSFLKNVLCVIATLFICVIFPPVILVVVPYTIYLLVTRNKGDRNHVGGKEWVSANKVDIKDETNKVIFDFYKKLFFEKAKNIQEALNDSELLKEYGNIIKSEYDKIVNGGVDKIMESATKEEKYLSAMRLESLKTFPSANVPKDIILNPRETCYFYSKIAAIDTVKKVRTNISYCGFKTSQGGFRLGNMSVSANSVEGIKRFDAGLLVVTDQRLIFKGTNNHTKTITIGSIIGIEKFEDNGVIIFLSNRETPVIIRFIADKMFFYNKEYDSMVLHNDLKWFERAMHEIVSSK